MIKVGPTGQIECWTEGDVHLLTESKGLPLRESGPILRINRVDPKSGQTTNVLANPGLNNITITPVSFGDAKFLDFLHTETTSTTPWAYKVVWEVNESPGQLNLNLTLQRAKTCTEERLLEVEVGIRLALATRHERYQISANGAVRINEVTPLQDPQLVRLNNSGSMSLTEIITTPQRRRTPCQLRATTRGAVEMEVESEAPDTYLGLEFVSRRMPPVKLAPGEYQQITVILEQSWL